jgi:hypothetical protein
LCWCVFFALVVAGVALIFSLSIAERAFRDGRAIGVVGFEFVCEALELVGVVEHVLQVVADHVGLLVCDAGEEGVEGDLKDLAGCSGGCDCAVGRGSGAEGKEACYCSVNVCEGFFSAA